MARRTSYLNPWILCTGCTVCRGRRDAQERPCTGCTVCRGRRDAQERPCTGCTVCRGRTTAGMQEVGQRRSSCRGAAISQLVLLVPKPRINLTRFHGVFAPHSKYRALVTPAKRGKGKKVQAADQAQDQTSAERRASMAGFCSCKTGIHAIPGNNLGQATETGICH